jgi:hypothetical protein
MVLANDALMSFKFFLLLHAKQSPEFCIDFLLLAYGWGT